jgi:hypothetical protein
MFQFWRRSAIPDGQFSRATIENLEGRRLLSAGPTAAGLHLSVPRHLTAVATQQINLDLGVVGPDIPTGSMALSVVWGEGKSALRQDAFLSGNGDGTNDVFTVNPTNLGAGVHKMRLTISIDGTVAASVSRPVRFLPHSANGLALWSVAGMQFTGIVGYLDRPLASDELLSINWGDGTVDNISSTQTSPDNRTAVVASHTYTRTADYVLSVVRGNVVGPFQGRANYAENVIVSTMHVPTAVPPSSNGLELQAVSGKALSHTLGFLDVSPANNRSYWVEWGDGTHEDIATQPTPDNRLAFLGAHTYAQPGTYVVTGSFNVIDPLPTASPSSFTTLVHVHR